MRYLEYLMEQISLEDVFPNLYEMEKQRIVELKKDFPEYYGQKEGKDYWNIFSINPKASFENNLLIVTIGFYARNENWDNEPRTTYHFPEKVNIVYRVKFEEVK